MRIKCEYLHDDVKRLIIRDLQEKFPGLVAEENVAVGGEQLIPVEVTLAARVASAAPSVVPSPPSSPALPTAPKVTRSPFDDPPELPPPPRPHSEREFNPAHAAEPAGIETWGIKPRG